jgi:hypothetical protein
VSEAVAPEHPAHRYLANRYRRTIAYFAHLIEVAQNEQKLDKAVLPYHEAVRLIALWEGLQVKALVRRDFGHIGEQLDRHLRSVVGEFHALPTPSTN